MLIRFSVFLVCASHQNHLLDQARNRDGFPPNLLPIPSMVCASCEIRLQLERLAEFCDGVLILALGGKRKAKIVVGVRVLGCWRTTSRNSSVAASWCCWP
jgi:hypothetical protein